MSILSSLSLSRFFATFAGSLLSTCLLGLVYLPDNSWAEDSTLLPSSTTTAPAPHLPSGAIFQLSPVTVIASPEPMTGHGAEIQGDILEKLPLRNNSLNEALGILPGVQFSDEAFLATQGGEIRPPQLSISGGKVFENNFTIDGISNNSLLDPQGATDPVSNNDVPGHAQGVFLDASLIGRVMVYDSNVSARYGRFKGGVVEAETIDPQPWPGGKVFYRTTRDDWTSFHMDRDNKESFRDSTNHKEQPKFRKHAAGIDLHLPITPRFHALGAYRLLHSTIPLRQDGQTKTQRRTQENFLIKTVFQASEAVGIDLLWAYTPYKASYFKDGFHDSDFDLYGGGYLLSAKSRVRLSIAELEIQAAYQHSENSRSAPPHMTQIQNPDGSWEKDGFLGDIEKNQQNLLLKSDLIFQPFSLGTSFHQFNTGLEIQHIQGSTERAETSYLYTYANGQIPRRTIYEKADAEALLRQYALYLENIITWGRLEIRPGGRLDYDDYTHNLNLAPRLAAALDLFGNRRTVLVAGINRYYANPLITYKLREGLKPTYQERWSEDDGWSFFSQATTNTRYSQLKTPYAEELVAGVDQQLFGGKGSFKYIHRSGRDEFAKTFGPSEQDGYRYNSLNNNGRSRHESYILSWEKQWPNHYLAINGTYQETKSSNESYDELLAEEDLVEQVWHNGRLYNKGQLPRKDFNRPWVINLTYVGRLPQGFSFSGTAKYRSGYDALLNTYKRNPEVMLADGTNPFIYEEVKKGGSVTLSCRLGWETSLFLSHRVMLSLEAINLLNKKTRAGGSDDYEIGRQIWAGMEYRF